MANAVDITERYLQLLAVLRSAEGAPVPRSRLVTKVPAYKALADDFTALKKLMQNDHKALTKLGFDIEDVAPLGEESRFVLRAGPWRLPVKLAPYEQGLLVWMTAAAAATAAQAAPAKDLSALVGSVPQAVDLVQVALASGRSVIVDRHGKDVVLEPGRLMALGGRWFLIGRYAGSTQLYGLRLDRLEDVRLGQPMTDLVEVPDPQQVLDSTAWRKHEPRDAELRCRTDHLSAVASWFPRAQVTQDGEESVLRFSYRNESALLTRVIGLAGAVRIVGPACARDALVAQVGAVLEQVDA